MSVRGVLQVHSAPPALCPHIEWAVAGVIGVPVSLPWVNQRRGAWHGAGRTELAGRVPAPRRRSRRRWPAGTGCGSRSPRKPAPAATPSATATRPDLACSPRSRWPTATSSIPESRLRAAMALAARPRLAGSPRSGAPSSRRGPGWAALEDELARLLGQPWDDELEPFRLRRRRRAGPLAARHRLSPPAPTQPRLAGTGHRQRLTSHCPRCRNT